MAINAEQETLVSLADAARLLPTINGRKHSIPSLYRWCRRGISGVQLEYVRVGRSIATSREALCRFFAALASVDTPIQSPVAHFELRKRTPRAIRQASLEAADRAMEELGVRKCKPAGAAPAAEAELC